MKSVNILKTQSLLMELIPEALSQLGDDRINSLNILEVDCKHGKYDAVVYFEHDNASKDELKETITQLKKANGFIKSYCLGATSWYKCPNFKFEPDDQAKRLTDIDRLFDQIADKKDQDGV